MNSALLRSLGICPVAALFEGVCAGAASRIAVGYYAICLAILFHCVSLAPSSLRNAALVPMGGVMAVILLLLLLRLDRPAAWWLAPNLGSLFFADAFGYQVWKLNPPLPSC